jgi:phosphatidylglycerol:prolipoprotein diacylglycerol transferase
MRKVLFEIPAIHWKIHGFGLMLCLAFLAAIFLAEWRARRSKLDPDWVYDLAFWILVGGLVGARGFYVAQYWGKHVRSWVDIFAIWEGGIVLYGGVLGAAIAGLYRAWKLRLPVLAMADSIAPAVALGLAIGRLGCFLNGCCYGDPCELPWAVEFPSESPVWYHQVRDGEIVYPASNAKAPWRSYSEVLDRNGQIDRIVREVENPARPERPVVVRRLVENPITGLQEPLTVRVVSASVHPLRVHPTQLYSVIDGLLLMALLLGYFPLRRTDGELAALLLIVYPISRFLIEQLRGDEPAFFLGLTISQNVSLVLLAFGVVFWVFLRHKPAIRHADQEVATVPAAASVSSR